MDNEAIDYKYALKCIYNAHAGDVRMITSTPNGGILTGSRDNTAKIWAPAGKSFKEVYAFTRATSFISSVCVIPESNQYPKGLFLAGSNDFSIYGFTPDSSEPVFVLLGHSGPVCSLSYTKQGYIVSGSWDKSARIWSAPNCIFTLQGHSETVWATAIFPKEVPSRILTGSADRTIRLWDKGVCTSVFTGHEDCVRGLAVVSESEFLSCGNDSTIRLWTTNGDCLKIFNDHTDYVYSVTLLGNGTDFASCSEDQNIKIWRNGICAQTIVIAPKTLWSLACLSNGDIAIGTSDGKVYVLERVSVDYFENMSIMNNEQPETSMITVDEKDGFVMSNASDIRSSIYNGETVIFYEHQNSSMYICQYNHENGSTVKKQPLSMQLIADTFYKKPKGDPSAGPSGNVEFSKDKYDYSFTVEVENVKFKLEFNKGENPWDVANKFVADHNLQIYHVGQIVDFIIRNTVASFVNEFFPVKKHMSYLNGNIAGLKAKLMEFCDQVGEEFRITQSQADDLVSLYSYSDRVTNDQLSSLDKMLFWKDGYLYPALDLLRLIMTSKVLIPKVISKEFMNHLLFIYRSTKENVNRVLIEKIFCNLFSIVEAEDLLECYQEKMLDVIKEHYADERIQRAGSSVYLNFAIASYSGFNLKMENFCSNVYDVLHKLVDTEAIVRILLAIGTVCTRNSLAVIYFRSVCIKDVISVFKDRNPKISKLVELLVAEF